MTNTEKVKELREKTFSPILKCQMALAKANGDIGEAIKILVADKQADANEMANRAADACIVHSYVHNNRVGAMVVLASQTDFVAKNELFLALAKDICMHIVSTPVAPLYVNQYTVPQDYIQKMTIDLMAAIPTNKPDQVRKKIVEGKLSKFYNEACLLNQAFIKDDTKTVEQLINTIASTLGEKIEVKRFVKLTAQ